MPLILAIVADPHEAAQLATLIHGRLSVDLVQAAEVGEGLLTLEDRVPDLILTSPLMSPFDDGVLDQYLRDLGPHGAHVQTLRIPVLGQAPKKAQRAGFLLRRRSKTVETTPAGCEPNVFADEIAQYLARAAEEKQLNAPVGLVVDAPAQEVEAQTREVVWTRAYDGEPPDQGVSGWRSDLLDRPTAEDEPTPLYDPYSTYNEYATSAPAVAHEAWIDEAATAAVGESTLDAAVRPVVAEELADQPVAILTAAERLAEISRQELAGTVTETPRESVTEAPREAVAEATPVAVPEAPREIVAESSLEVVADERVAMAVALETAAETPIATMAEPIDAALDEPRGTFVEEPLHVVAIERELSTETTLEATVEEIVEPEPHVQAVVDTQPAVEEPVAEELALEARVADEPVAEDHVFEAQVAEEPLAEAPVVEESMVAEPIAAAPIAEERAEQPVMIETAAQSVAEADSHSHKARPSFSAALAAIRAAWGRPARKETPAVVAREVTPTPMAAANENPAPEPIIETEPDPDPIPAAAELANAPLEVDLTGAVEMLDESTALEPEAIVEQRLEPVVATQTAPAAEIVKPVAPVDPGTEPVDVYELSVEPDLRELETQLFQPLAPRKRTASAKPVAPAPEPPRAESRQDASSGRRKKGGKRAAKVAEARQQQQQGPPKDQPVQDEWGIFDPNQCGFAALVEKLDEVSEKPQPAPNGNKVRVISCS